MTTQITASYFSEPISNADVLLIYNLKNINNSLMQQQKIKLDDFQSGKIIIRCGSKLLSYLSKLTNTYCICTEYILNLSRGMNLAQEVWVYATYQYQCILIVSKHHYREKAILLINKWNITTVLFQLWEHKHHRNRGSDKFSWSAWYLYLYSV